MAGEFENYKLPYETNPQFKEKVVYFSMEYALHQALKIYSGGLGFLAGSHLMAAYDLKQPFIAIGILWKYGYYDQARNQDQTLLIQWNEKVYNFLVDTGIKFQIDIHESPVWVKVWYLPPETFQSAPLFLMSTDVPENDYLSQTITHKLYEATTSTKLAQFILLGIGGATLVDILGINPDKYHLNEAHGVSAVFHLLKKYNNDREELKKHLVFTTHTPEEAGNETHDIHLCERMSYFGGYSLEKVRELTGFTELFDHSLCALRFAIKANGVSKLHGEVSRAMWSKYENICPIDSITNSQNFRYWADKALYHFMDEKNDGYFDERKRYLKRKAFNIVADNSGKLFDPNILTIVWARRFAGYKRADLITRNRDRFHDLLTQTKYPLQMIWAGKPYPSDYSAIGTFNNLVHLSKEYKNMAVCTGYEMALSKMLKQSCDIWLNNPRVPREASGTSGMTAAMNGGINFSTNDGWIPEFIRHGENGFLIPMVDYHNLHVEEQDDQDLIHLYEILENEILPMYYENPNRWRQIAQQGMKDVRYTFDSIRMATEYYDKMYSA